jgi:hypothetical protein
MLWTHFHSQALTLCCAPLAASSWCRYRANPNYKLLMLWTHFHSQALTLCRAPQAASSWCRCRAIPHNGHIRRVGQNHIYTVYIRYFWQGNYQIYGHIRCMYTVLANPTHTFCTCCICSHALLSVHTALPLRLLLPDVGEVQTLTVGHNNSGQGPEWCMEMAEVRSLSLCVCMCVCVCACVYVCVCECVCVCA